MTNFTLELLHIADQESNSASVINAPNTSAVMNALEAQDLGNDGLPDNTIRLSSGDAIIPGLFYDASGPVYGSGGIADIQIQNELGIQAISFGNHEFDFGTEEIAALISGDAPGTILGADFTGTDFPYLSLNLDFSTDPFMAPLAVAGGQAPQGNVVSSSTVIDVNGELIGVVGATTPTLPSISSPGSLAVSPTWAGTTPTEAELDALAALIQAEVDALIAANPSMNKVVLLAHMQQITVEQELAERLEHVDIIVAGGSNTLLADGDDVLRGGDTAQGAYPIVVQNAGGTDTMIVNTDGSYTYVGRLVVDFDANGHLIASSYDETVSGAYATDDTGVAALNAQGLTDPEIQQIADEIEAQIIATESNVFGFSNVFLNGNRSGSGAADDPDGVRTQETNLGNLTADANLAEAQDNDASVLISIKNGGGIRASIGEVTVPPGGTDYVRVANSEVIDGDGNVIKPAGGISQNDIQTTLAFNNGLVLMTLTAEEIIGLLEHGVGALPGVSGRFPQISGIEFTYDVNLPSGQRLVDVAIVDGNGDVIVQLMQDREMVAAADSTYRVVTLDFLSSPRFDDQGNYIGAGDGYPFPNTNTDPAEGEVGDPAVIARVNKVFLEEEGVQTGDATFADDGTEQDALAEYLDDMHGTQATAFDQADTGIAGDTRIDVVEVAQVSNVLNYARTGTVFGDVEADPAEVSGTLTYAITGGDDAGVFAIDPATGNLSVVNSLALTGGNQGFALDVQITDDQGGSTTELVAVVVDDRTTLTPADGIIGTGAGDLHLGTDGADVFRAGAGEDVIFGGAGDDLILGGGYDDDIYGEAGRDRIIGQTGDDFIFGGDDTDILRGGAGDDRLAGEAGNDILIGQVGADVFAFDGAAFGIDRIMDFEVGADTIELAGAPSFSAWQPGDDTIIGVGASRIIVYDTDMADVMDALVIV